MTLLWLLASAVWPAQCVPLKDYAAAYAVLSQAGCMAPSSTCPATIKNMNASYDCDTTNNAQYMGCTVAGGEARARPPLRPAADRPPVRPDVAFINVNSCNLKGSVASQIGLVRARRAARSPALLIAALPGLRCVVACSCRRSLIWTW